MANSARRRVLIVDDEPLVLEVLSEHFEIDYDVEIALNGVDALDAIRRQRPDVVLLDIKMPGMSGVEVLKAIKQIDESVAVIMVTANEQVALAAGRRDHGNRQRASGPRRRGAEERRSRLCAKAIRLPLPRPHADRDSQPPEGTNVMMTPLSKVAEDDPYARRRLRYRVA